VVYQESETWNDILKWERNSIEIEQKKKRNTKNENMKSQWLSSLPLWTKTNDWVVYCYGWKPMR